MKRLLFTIFLVNIVLPLTSFAQDNTKVGLPEGAIARLGKGGINLMRFSPDGTILIGSNMECGSTPIKLSDAETGRDLGILSGHTEPVETLVFSHDRKTLASGSQDGTVLLWDWDEVIAKKRQENR